MDWTCRALGSPAKTFATLQLRLLDRDSSMVLRLGDDRKTRMMRHTVLQASADVPATALSTQSSSLIGNVHPCTAKFTPEVMMYRNRRQKKLERSAGVSNRPACLHRRQR